MPAPVALATRMALRQVVPVNLVRNPGFEIDTTDWVIGASAGAAVSVFAAQSGWADTGTKAGRFTMTLAALNDFAGPFTLCAGVKGGQSYQLQAKLNILTATNIAATYLQAQWYDANLALINAVNPDNKSGTGLKTLQALATAPAGAAYVVLLVYAQASSAAGVWDAYIDSVMVAQSSTLLFGYGDGDSAGWQWDGDRQASTSRLILGAKEFPSIGTRLFTPVAINGVTNLLKDPSFETLDGTQWAGSNASILKSATPTPVAGANVVKMTATAVGTNNSGVRNFFGGTDGRFAVTPGLTYTGAASFQRDASATNRLTRVYLDWYDSSNTRISVTPGADVNEIPGQWVRPTVTLVAPAGAVTGSLVVEVGGVPQNEIHYADAALVVQGTVPVSYLDGDAADSVWRGTPHGSQSVRVNDRLGQLAYANNKLTYDLFEAYQDGGVMTKDPTLAYALRNTGLFIESTV